MDSQIQYDVLLKCIIYYRYFETLISVKRNAVPELSKIRKLYVLSHTRNPLYIVTLSCFPSQTRT